jgi:hypothetical protein
VPSKRRRAGTRPSFAIELSPIVGVHDQGFALHGRF